MVSRLHPVNGKVGEGVRFDRIRRITWGGFRPKSSLFIGYLVGTLDHFNNGKRAEEADRVKHMKV